MQEQFIHFRRITTMKKKLLFTLLMLIMPFISCYDGLIDTYNGKVYHLHDRGPAGGWIFYINPNWERDGWRYLEAAPEDCGDIVWSNIAGTEIGVAAQGTAINTGKTNTIAIAGQSGHTQSAAKLCLDYSEGGYDDWFLPSKDELWQMCWNLQGVKYNTITNPDVSVPVGNFSTGPYWSSSEVSSGGASGQYFNNGLQLDLGKTNTESVRAIRAF